MIKIQKKEYIKFFVLVVAFCFFSSNTVAMTKIRQDEPLQIFFSVDADTATQIACMKLEQLGMVDFSISSDTKEVLVDAQGLLGYVFDLEPQGYLVTSACRDLPPVLAYSFTSDFSFEGDHDAVLSTMLKNDIRQRFNYRSSMSSDILLENQQQWYLLEHGQSDFDTDLYQWPPKGTTAYGGWLETTWSQSSPYNNFCPIDLASGDRSVAGCPSVAMAQILQYHQTTNNIIFNDTDDYRHNYAGNVYWIDDNYETYDFPSFPELNAYLTTAVEHYQQHLPLTDDDIAALVFACGVAAKQVYHPTGSGTFGVGQAFTAYLRFGFSDVVLLDDDDADVYTRIQSNIKLALPVHLAVVNEAWTSGHNLVIDGYNSDGFYHLNFGWGGVSDGWYLLPDEIPYDLTVLEGVIVDIFDEYDGSHLKGSGSLNWDSVKKSSTVTGSFTLENGGDSGSSIDWEIIEYPSWGTWTFTPASGQDLTPENGPVTIQVSVKAPSERKTHFSGHITVVSKDDPKDFCIIHCSLTTPKSSEYRFLFKEFLQNHPRLFPILQYLYGL